jgi:hypothetical protein
MPPAPCSSGAQSGAIYCYTDYSTRAHLGMVIRIRVPDTTGTGTGTIFYPWVAPVLDLNQDGYGTGIFSHMWITRRVPDTLLPL